MTDRGRTGICTWNEISEGAFFSSLLFWEKHEGGEGEGRGRGGGWGVYIKRKLLGGVYFYYHFLAEVVEVAFGIVFLAFPLDPSLGNFSLASLFTDITFLRPPKAKKEKGQEKAKEKKKGKQTPIMSCSEPTTNGVTKKDDVFHGWLATDATSPMQHGAFTPKAWRETDVDIRVTHCGVCASDLHVLRSGWVSLLSLSLSVSLS